MKKLLAVLLIMSIFMLVGCGSDKDVNNDPSETNNSNVSQNVESKVDFDESIYSENFELTTESGKVVKIYYDPEVVEYIAGEDEFGKFIYLGEMSDLAVKDAKSAKEYIDSIISNNDGYLEIGIQEEIEVGGYKVHYFTLNDTASGSFAGKEWAIELDSDVVLSFRCITSVKPGSQIETELNAIKFVVE